MPRTELRKLRKEAEAIAPPTDGRIFIEYIDEAGEHVSWDSLLGAPPDRWRGAVVRYDSAFEGL